MDTRKMLENHVHTLGGLMKGGIRRGMPNQQNGSDAQISAINLQWETQRNLLKRVLAEPGEPKERLHDWRDRTSSFLDKYPERGGWDDREGQHWDANSVLEAIDKLLEQIEVWETEVDTFDDYEDEG